MTEQPQDSWWTVEDAAAYVKTGKRTLYAEVRRKRLRAAIVGGRRELRFKRAWLDLWMEQCATPQEIQK